MQLSHGFHHQSLTTPMAGSEDAQDRAWLDTTSESEGEIRPTSSPEAAANCSNDLPHEQRNPPLNAAHVLHSVKNERRERPSELHGLGGNTTEARRPGSKWPLGLQVGAKVCVTPSKTKRVQVHLPEDGLFSPDLDREQGAARTSSSAKVKGREPPKPAERRQKEGRHATTQSFKTAKETSPKSTAVAASDQSPRGRCLFPLFLHLADKNGVVGASVGQRRSLSAQSTEPHSPAASTLSEPVEAPGFTTPRSSGPDAEANFDIVNVRSATKVHHQQEVIRFWRGRRCRVFFDVIRKQRQVRRWIQGKEALREIQTLQGAWYYWRESLHRALAQERIVLRSIADETQVASSQTTPDETSSSLASHFSRFTQNCRASSVHRSWKHRLLLLMSRNERAGAMNRFRLAALIHSKLRSEAESQHTLVEEDNWGAMAEAFAGWRSHMLKVSTAASKDSLSDFIDASGRRRFHFQLWVVATIRSTEARILVEQIVDAQQNPLAALAHSLHVWFLHVKRAQTHRRAAIDAEKREFGRSVEARSEQLDVWMGRQNARDLVRECFDAFRFVMDSSVGTAVDWARISVRLQGNSALGDAAESLPDGSMDTAHVSVGSESKDVAEEPALPGHGLSSDSRSQDPDSSRDSTLHDDPDVESEDLNPSASGRERVGRHTLRRSLGQASATRDDTGRHSLGASRSSHHNQRLLAPVLSAALLMESDGEDDRCDRRRRGSDRDQKPEQQQQPQQQQQQQQHQQQQSLRSKQPLLQPLPAPDGDAPSPPLPLALTTALHASSNFAPRTPTSLSLSQQPAIVSSSPQRRFWVEMDRRRWPLYLKDPPSSSHSSDSATNGSSSSSSLRRARTTLVFDGNNAGAEPEHDTSTGSN